MFIYFYDIYLINQNHFFEVQHYHSNRSSSVPGKWLKEDWVHFNYYESDIIDMLQKEYSKIIPCEYSGKAESSSELHYGLKSFKYKFKLLV